MTSPNFINSNNADVQINGGQLFNADNVTYNTSTSNQYASMSAIEILNRHIAPGAFLNSRERFDPPRCDLGTRLTIIERIMDWVTDPKGHSSILWLHGPAGAGKSALGQTIAEMCQGLGILAAVFFFSRNAVSAERSDGNCLIASLVHQLIDSFPKLRRYIKKHIGTNNRIFELGLQAQAEKLLVYPLNKISKSFRFILSKLSTIFNTPYPRLFVVDGLDECRDINMQLEILEVLARAAKDLNLPFRILVASRPESHIRHFFDHNPAVKHIAVHRLDLAHDCSSDDDIRIYLSRRFKEVVDSHPLREYIPPEWPTPEAIEKIASRSSGQFIYAATVIKYIQSPKHRPTDRLKVILGTLPVPINDKPYAALDALYTLVFSSVNDPRVMQIFSLLAISRTPDDGFGILNTPAMIDRLLLYQPGNTQLILIDFLSIVAFDKEDSPIEHYHASLNDFLLDRSRSGDFSVDLLKTHKQLVHRYLRLIKKPKDYSDWATLESDIGAFISHYDRATVLPTNLSTDIVPHDIFHDSSSDNDIQLYLSTRFGEIADTHPMRDDIPSEWPPEDAIKQIIRHSVGQFLYAATVMIYIQSRKNRPTDRLKVILGTLPVSINDKPYAALDAMYTLVFSSVNDPRVMQIFGLLAIPRTPNDGLGTFNTPATIDKLLFYREGDTLRILSDFSPIVAFDKHDSPIKHYHASLNDFLLDPSRSGRFCVDPQKMHGRLARVYLHLIQENTDYRNLAKLESDIGAFVSHYGNVTTILDDNFLPDAVRQADLTPDANSDGNIRLYLSIRFREIIDKHPCREYILSPEPTEHVIKDMVSRSSGHFIYAATIIIYMQSLKLRPLAPVEVTLRMLPVNTNKEPYAALDALYTLLFSSVNDPSALQVFGLLAISRTPYDWLGTFNIPNMIDKLLSYQLGNTLLILNNFSSLVDFDKDDSPITHYNESLNDFLLDSSRSGILSVDIQKVHETLARGYLDIVNIQASDKSGYENNHIESDFVAFVKNYGRLTSTSISNELVVTLKDMDFCRIFDKFTVNHNAEGYWLWDSGVMEQLFRQLTHSETFTNSGILNVQMDTFLQATRHDSFEELWKPIVELLTKPYFQKSMFCIINACDCTKDENLKACQVISPLATKLSYYVFYSHISRIGADSMPRRTTSIFKGAAIRAKKESIHNHLWLAYMCGCILDPDINSDATNKSTDHRGRPTSSAYTVYAFEAHLHYVIFILPISSFSNRLLGLLDKFKTEMNFWSRPDSPLRRFLPQFQELQIQISTYEQRTRH